MADALDLAEHPHVAAVLGPVIAGTADPSHAYLLVGAGIREKRLVAEHIAAALLARGAADVDSATQRARARVHPDLSWVTPSGAHEMLRRDVDDPVVAAAARTPFEASYRVFVLERVDTLNDEAANALLKTLEEPAPYVVMLLLAERASDVLPTIASRCQSVRFAALNVKALSAQLRALGLSENTALACARLSLGDAERAEFLAGVEGQELRKQTQAFARCMLVSGGADRRPWEPLLALARERGEAAAERVDEALVRELEYLPRKEHRKQQTEFAERRRRVARRAETAVLDHALQLIGLWYRDLACVAADAAAIVHNSDCLEELRADIGGRTLAQFTAAVDLVDDMRARLRLNVTVDLAAEALAFRLQQLLAPANATVVTAAASPLPQTDRSGAQR